LIVEWVAEAGKRLWIVRITQEEPVGTALKDVAPFLDSLRMLAISSDTLDRPTTIGCPPGCASPSTTGGTAAPNAAPQVPQMPNTGAIASSRMLWYVIALGSVLLLVGIAMKLLADGRYS
jgi:hypothetical protein